MTSINSTLNSVQNGFVKNSASNVSQNYPQAKVPVQKDEYKTTNPVKKAFLRSISIPAMIASIGGFGLGAWNGSSIGNYHGFIKENVKRNSLGAYEAFGKILQREELKPIARRAFYRKKFVKSLVPMASGALVGALGGAILGILTFALPVTLIAALINSGEKKVKA